MDTEDKEAEDEIGNGLRVDTGAMEEDVEVNLEMALDMDVEGE